MTRDNVIAEARSWIGTPFHHRAMVKGAGVDCAQFLIGVFSGAGMIDRFDTGDYPQDWHHHREEQRFLAFVTQYARQIETPKPGDVAMFQFGRCVSHGAIVLAWPLVIHAYFRQGVVITDATGNELGGRLHSFWTLFEDGQ